MQTILNCDTLGVETIDMEDLEADLFGFIPVNFIRDLIPQGREPNSHKSRTPVAADRKRCRK